MKSRDLPLGVAIAASATFCGMLGSAHQQWGDGSPVSEKVKQLCCGDAEVHFLPPGSVHAFADVGISTDFRNRSLMERNCRALTAMIGASGRNANTPTLKWSPDNLRCGACSSLRVAAKKRLFAGQDQRFHFDYWRRVLQVIERLCAQHSR